MRRVPAVLLSLGLAAQALAQPGVVPPKPASTQPPAPPPKPADKPTAAQPTTTAQPATAQPAAAQPPTGQPAAPQNINLNQPPPEPPKLPPVPVPDGPVVNKQELEGGLVAEDIKIGDGYEVKPGGAVVAFYHGTLKADGKVFDSSFNRGEPIGFPLNGVIPGWQKGVPGMKIGGVRRLTIPAAMAYGAQSPSPDIPANSDLVFVIQLVDAVQFTDIKEGEGDPATGSFVAVTAYTMTGADGKELEHADAAHPYIWIPNEIQGLTFGFEGMKVGGKRKIHIPKELNNSNPQLAPNRVQKVPVEVEIELLALRNLNRRR